MKRALFFTMAAVGILAAFILGAQYGHSKTFDVFGRALETEVAGSTALRLEQLVMIREGDYDRALSLIESQVDSAITTLAQARTWEELPRSTQNTLFLAKKYRDRYPSKTPHTAIRQQLDERLAEIPDDLPHYWEKATGRCASVLREHLFGNAPE